MNLVAEFTRQFQGTKDDPTLIFERLYSTTPSDLWDAMTTPERLARWFGTFTGPAPRAVGDSFDVDLGGGAGEDMGHGTILECVKPQRLAYRWQWQTEDPAR